MENFVISNSEIQSYLGLDETTFPKYTTVLMNIANRTSQGTRPNVVGQLSELIQEFDGDSYQEWEQWYLERHPDAIEKATKKIQGMILNFKEAIDKIDEEVISRWTEDLILRKTYFGFRFQDIILEKIAETMKTTYRKSTPADESQGIDGYIGEKPVSIKPTTYTTMDVIDNNITVPIIYYEKKSNGVHIKYESF